MDSDFALMMVGVSLIMLTTQCVVFAWDKWVDKSWHSLRNPSTLIEVFLDWIIYTLTLTVLSLLMREIFCLACSSCQHC